MEGTPRPTRADLEKAPQLLEELTQLRKSHGHIYQIARKVQVLRGLGHAVDLTEDESQQVKEALTNIRNGETDMELEPGYVLARWLMINNYFWPGSEIVTSDDKAKINEAARTYKEQENFYQLASLINTVQFIHSTVEFGEVTPEQQLEINRELEETK